MKNSEVLYGAADLIVRDGWWNGDMESDAVGALGECASNAIGVVVGSEGWRDGTCARRALAEFLTGGKSESPSEDLRVIFDWNDSQESGEPVITALLAAGVIEEARETVRASAVIA